MHIRSLVSLVVLLLLCFAVGGAAAVEDLPDPPGQLGDDLRGLGFDGDGFGRQFAITPNGKTIVASATNVDPDGIFGFVTGNFSYVQVTRYDRKTDSWVQVGSLIQSDPLEPGLGSQLGISNDGKTVAASKPYDRHVDIYELDNDLDDWVLTAKLQDNVTHEEWVDYEAFGIGMALSGDGQTVAITRRHNPFYDFPGAVKVYRRSGDAYEQIGQTIEDEQFVVDSYTEFGITIDISNDGNTVAIGNPRAVVNGMDNAGRVVIVQYDSTLDKWVPKGRPVEGKNPREFFSTSLDLNQNGNVFAMGGAGGGNPNTGDTHSVRVYRYKKKSDSWELLGGEIFGSESFGSSVAIDKKGSTIVVGQPFITQRDVETGQVLAFQLKNGKSGEWEQLFEPIVGDEIGDVFGAEVALSRSGIIVAGSGNSCCGPPRGSSYARAFSLKRWKKSQMKKKRHMKKRKKTPKSSGKNANGI